MFPDLTNQASHYPDVLALARETDLSQRPAMAGDHLRSSQQSLSPHSLCHIASARLCFSAISLQSSLGRASHDATLHITAHIILWATRCSFLASRCLLDVARTEMYSCNQAFAKSPFRESCNFKNPGWEQLRLPHPRRSCPSGPSIHCPCAGCSRLRLARRP